MTLSQLTPSATNILSTLKHISCFHVKSEVEYLCQCMVRSFINVLLETLQFQAILRTCNIKPFSASVPPTPASRFTYHLSPRPWYHHASSYATDYCSTRKIKANFVNLLHQKIIMQSPALIVQKAASQELKFGYSTAAFSYNSKCIIRV